MPKSSFLLCLVAGTFFGSWPLIMRSSGLNYVVAALALQLGSFIVFTPLLSGRANTTTILAVGVLVGLLAGIVNGFGQLSFQKLVSLKDVEISRFTVIVVTLQIIISVVGGYVIYHEPFTVRKTAGIVAAIVAVNLLVRR